MLSKTETKRLYQREYMRQRRQALKGLNVSQLTLNPGSDKVRGNALQGGQSRILATNSREIVERETGFEPATSYLEGRHSATELLPLKSISF
jgi:hypothetical protein